MKPFNTAFIVNPHAGNGSTGSKWPGIKALAQSRLGNFVTYITTGSGDARAFTKDAVAKGCTLIVCVGGDGTLNEVVNGVMAHDKSLISDLVLGFPFAPSDMVLRRAWAFEVGLFDESYVEFSEDLDINCRLALAGCKFASVDRVLNYSRHHSGRIIKKTNPIRLSQPIQSPRLV